MFKVEPIKVEFMFDFGSPNAYLAELIIPHIERRTGVKFMQAAVQSLVVGWGARGHAIGFGGGAPARRYPSRLTVG